MFAKMHALLRRATPPMSEREFLPSDIGEKGVCITSRCGERSLSLYVYGAEYPVLVRKISDSDRGILPVEATPRSMCEGFAWLLVDADARREACMSLEELLNRRDAGGGYVFSHDLRASYRSCPDLDWRTVWTVAAPAPDILRLLGQLGGFDAECRAVALHAADRACRVHVPSALRALGLDSDAARLSVEPELLDASAAQLRFRELNALAERTKEMLVANARMDMRATIYAASSAIDSARESISALSIADVVTSAVWAVIADAAAAHRAAAASSCREGAEVDAEAAEWEASSCREGVEVDAEAASRSAEDAGWAEDAHMAAAIYARVSWADVEMRLVGLVGRKSYA